jgi:hypothetical protein
MKTWVSGGKAPPFLTSASYRGQWSVSHLSSFTFSTNSIGGWVGPTAGLDTVDQRKISCPCQGSDLKCPTYRYADYAIPNENWKGKLKYKEKNLASASLSTTNTVWTALCLNWGVHREKPVVHSLQLWHGHCRRILMF